VKSYFSLFQSVERMCDLLETLEQNWVILKEKNYGKLIDEIWFKLVGVVYPLINFFCKLVWIV